jgi:uncharacterized spore protein YtfJ
MHRRIFTLILTGLWLCALGPAQNPPAKEPQAKPPQPAHELADALARRLGNELNVKTAVGEPIKIGSVTLIPIVMINVSFGGGGMALPGGPPAAQPAQKGQPSQTPKPAFGTPHGFFMSGEARPLGFVAVTKKGTRFISVNGTSGK